MKIMKDFEFNLNIQILHLDCEIFRDLIYRRIILKSSRVVIFMIEKENVGTGGADAGRYICLRNSKVSTTY